MGLEPVILEISSDEEACGLKESNASRCSELIELTDGETAESDDVVILDEFPSTSGENFASSRWRNRPFREGCDDFVVLDPDPDSIVSPFTSSSREGDGSDELHIVGEKGQVAYRDYPHSRDLCANFPFSSTPHEKHCNLCHCYVCDSPAPCIHWGNGSLSMDHCHSTDKEARWKSERNSFKKRSNEARHSQGPPNAYISSMPALHNPEPTQTVPLQVSASHAKKPVVVPGAQAKTQWSTHGQQYSLWQKHGADALSAQPIHPQNVSKNWISWSQGHKFFPQQEKFSYCKSNAKLCESDVSVSSFSIARGQEE